MIATKEQERKALEKIKKIVEDLGDGSYLSMAFDGCFAIAQDNIENDFGNSPKSSMKTLRINLEKATENLSKKEEEIISLRKDYDERIENLSRVHDVKDRLIKEKSDRIDQLNNQLHEAVDTSVKNWNLYREQEDRVEKLEQEIIKLKAKLYDMMTDAAE